jgi:transposase
MTPVYYDPTNYDLFIGIDTDKRSFSFTVRERNQKKHRKMPSNPDQFYQYIQNHYPHQKVVCAYEAGPTGFGLYDYLLQKEVTCFVTSPASIPKAPNERVKTNRIDSGKIAEYLMSGDFKPIRVPTGPYRDLRDLVKIMERYTYERKAAKQRIKSLLLYKNLHNAIQSVDSRWSRAYLRELERLACAPAERERLNMLLSDLTYARKNLAVIHRKLKQFCQEHQEIHDYMGYLESIPGIGFIIAVTILGTIGDPADLTNPREIAAFLGLAPSEYSTGDTVTKGSITHLGNKVLRSLLVESAWATIRKDTQLRQFYYRIRQKHQGQAASKIAITAVARKMTQIIYRILKDKRPYVNYSDR